MQFSQLAPGALTPSGGDWVGEWSASPSNVGLTQGQVESWVSSALNDAGGWTQVSGLTFDNIGAGGVVFRSVADLPGNAIGTCYYDTFPPHIDLKASFFGNKDLVNHEAAHAFFFATHSPEGSDSIEEPMEDPGEEGASATDIAQVSAWLDGADPLGLGAGTYWHPLDLPHYITKRDLSESSEISISLPVPVAREAGLETGNTLKAVFSPDYETMVAGDHETLGVRVAFAAPGIYTSDWVPIPDEAKDPGGVYIGLKITTSMPIDELSLGQAEIRVRGGTPTPAGCAPEDMIILDFDPPGRLTLEGGQYYGDYQIASDNFGYTEAEARAHVSAALESAGGWQRAGITFRETVDAPVTFRFVDGPFLCGGVMANGCTNPSGGTAEVSISYQRSEAGYSRNLINHESGHAYFECGHTGFGIMTGDSNGGQPTDCDIQSVADWLG